MEVSYSNTNTCAVGRCSRDDARSLGPASSMIQCLPWYLKVRSSIKGKAPKRVYHRQIAVIVLASLLYLTYAQHDRTLLRSTPPAKHVWVSSQTSKCYPLPPSPKVLHILFLICPTAFYVLFVICSFPLRNHTLPIPYGSSPRRARPEKDPSRPTHFPQIPNLTNRVFRHAV